MTPRPALGRLLRRRGRSAPTPLAEDAGGRLDPADEEILREVRPHTMTSPLRVEALLAAVRHVVARDVPGAFVECGVWRGGSVLAMVRQLQRLGRHDRDLFLYDTFEGMTEPTEHDTSAFDPPAREVWEGAAAAQERPWAGLFDHEVFNEHQVGELLRATGYPDERLHLVKGPVETTLPDHAPAELAILRLDTDWYESTLHELMHLYPRLSPGGVLIIDDYGHWDGCRRAVDEYFSTQAAPVLLQRVDYTGRLAVKW